ncbi:Indole-3-glycerol phosphate synthase [Porphyridium purpureum]|uniref:indole-3-glycerol-phosphate synthase n=1 Tax=Porphyridium purpureum TaxID=35688 RepID=A0A5J4YRR4_PORPP|nr:Indole-3-glycerol phosphate synthase [Porphyridium purpureum]|eukprot:POR6228..scf229_5
MTSSLDLLHALRVYEGRPCGEGSGEWSRMRHDARWIGMAFVLSAHTPASAASASAARGRAACASRGPVGARGNGRAAIAGELRMTASVAGGDVAADMDESGLFVKSTPDVLVSILQRKVEEVKALRAECAADMENHPVALRMKNKGNYPRSKAFIKALSKRSGTLSVIAEIKRRSPSKGKIGEIKYPAALARTYYDGGASCISVLTDGPGFGGTLDDLRAVVKEMEKERGNYPPPCPVIRKDFTIDEIQIAEAAEAGASAVLLIVAALGERTKELLDATHAYGLDALVEVHDEKDLEIAIKAGAELIGVNNRDLRTFNVSLETSERLRSLMPEGKILVAESGISDPGDAWLLRDMGYNAILVGEALVLAAEQSAYQKTGYASTSFNQCKGMLRAFRSKASTEFASPTEAMFQGADEGAKETLGELAMLYILVNENGWEKRAPLVRCAGASKLQFER